MTRKAVAPTPTEPDNARFSMSKLRRSPLTILVHLSVLLIVILWTLPTAGLLISSFRDKDQLALSGWWTSLTASEQNLVARTDNPDTQVQEGDVYVLSGQLLVDGSPTEIMAFGFHLESRLSLCQMMLHKCVKMERSLLPKTVTIK
ncbi:alpha-glucoside transport system permease protein AglG [Vibrio variabilis]|uniref:Alpha-glucoside transport system permease protein AglG n=1 Tax=Vibrio variabilis TaxID=990271 RepID=A0ABQ0JFQ9_9VIBR|nr:alpha-glucoside transport system permease protein AglG [Vibrio variabilis]